MSRALMIEARSNMSGGAGHLLEDVSVALAELRQL